MEQDSDFKFIDLEKIIKQKNPRLYFFLPKFLIRLLKKIVHQDEFNNDVNSLRPNKGIDFLKATLKLFDFKAQVFGIDELPKEGRYIFVSNHPLGGPDGIVLHCTVNDKFPGSYFMVNDILMHLPGMESCYLPLNLFGPNSKEYGKKIDEVFESDSQIIIFPAGLVSRPIGSKIIDLEWKKTFITKAVKYKRDIIPVYIDKTNSKFFYRVAKFRKFLGIKLNIEMLFLVDELYKHKHAIIPLYFGKPISYTTFDNTRKPDEWAAFVKEIVYELKNHFK
ncbi:MAG: 1-acyl-sn-glycerol-3-phosphate acyltransferase [Bacteroidales bacterium]